MKRFWFLISVSVVLGLLLAACGGGGGGAPVDMEKHDTDAFTMERPKDWNVDSLEMFGITILIASSKDIKAEAFMGDADPAEMFSDAPGVLIMAVPQEMAQEGGDFGFSVDEIKDLPNDEPDVEIVRQGDVTISGAKGYELVIKGEIEDFGNVKMGAHLAVLEHDSGPMAFIGFSPDKDMDKNLDIFKYMFESIKFK